MKKHLLFLLLSINIISFCNDKIDSLNKLSEHYRNSDVDRALSYAEEALKMSQKNNLPGKTAQSMNNIAAVYCNKGDYGDAIEYYTEALDIYKETKNERGIAKTKNNLGVVYLMTGDLSEAYMLFQEALGRYNQLGDKTAVASCLNNMGLIMQKQNEHEKALEYFNRALIIKSKSEDKYSLKQTLFNIGTSYYYISNYDSAIYYLDKCLHIENKINDLYGKSVTLNSIGLVELAKGHSTQALNLFNQSLQIARDIDDKKGIIQNLDNIGIAYLIEEKHDDAFRYIDSSLSLAIEYKMIDKIKEAYKDVSFVFEKQEKHKEALKAYRMYVMLVNQVIDEQKKTMNLQSDFKLLEVEKQKNKQKVYLIALGALIILLIITAIFILKHKQLKHRSAIEKTLAEQQKIRFKSVLETQEQERKRIAGDLHDSIGYMLSTAKLNMSGLEDNLRKAVPDDDKLLDNAITLVDDACNEVRNISHNLMPGTLIRLGLKAALKDYIAKINESQQIKIKHKFMGIDQRLDETVEITLYRITQELINNIIKHAEATTAEVTIIKEDNRTKLTISDNGKGMNAKQIEASPGIGWNNIYSRISMLNGKIKIDSKRRIGTTVIIEIMF